jgi:hypothetical protein
VNFYTFRRPDVKMTEKPGGVNIKIAIGGEECSAKMKKIHGGRRQGLMPPTRSYRKRVGVRGKTTAAVPGG